MRNSSNNGFWSGGHAAWWRGLREEIACCRRERDGSPSAEDRQRLDERLQQLEQERQEAKEHSNGWYF
jgi:hypothetical protein